MNTHLCNAGQLQPPVLVRETPSCVPQVRHTVPAYTSRRSMCRRKISNESQVVRAKEPLPMRPRLAPYLSRADGYPGMAVT